MGIVARRWVIALALSVAPCAAGAEEEAQEADKAFTLAAPPTLGESGLLDYLLPRFSLKTGVRVTLDADAPDLTLAEGAPALTEPALTEPVLTEPVLTEPVLTEIGGPAYAARIEGAEDPDARRFLDWLTSEIGRRAIAAFEGDGAPRYAPPEKIVAIAPAAAPTGDAALGETVSLRRCGRCHVVNETNRFGGIGSTPSFGALRSLPRWRERFEAFWTLNPHPAFTQVEGVTEPFDPARPPPIAPLALTLDEVDAILAFVALMEPKDLGGPLVAN